MLRRLTLLLLLLSGSIAAHAALDLAAAVSEYEAGGFQHRQLTFRDGETRVEYELPDGWEFRSESQKVNLTPPNKKFAEGVIEARPLDKPQPLDEAAAKTREEAFLAAVPPASQFVKIEEEGAGAFILRDSPSVQITASYQLMGEKFQRVAVFVNLPDTQLVFRLTARKDDFDELWQQFRRSVNSWHWVETGSR